MTNNQTLLHTVDCFAPSFALQSHHITRILKFGFAVFTQIATQLFKIQYVILQYLSDNVSSFEKETLYREAIKYQYWVAF
ncbi:MAG: hypothetical protein US42_C0011G0006 [Candidatus Magasanikbacteria bacterium GW2011_GWC2_37_14]|uniref:Uncharacterized protein n=1 Tax=Candidatus Magasanikbacteria bacterium GW2011_GWC2_37_14 TaxID=1619046 RepID=A0A0G0G838_9BACT|nr:MAG: hypothetical protein US42_C0011G0006 [Candidatus Magasanikbacteria bacterium GW2011_GWC2_37_14]